MDQNEHMEIQLWEYLDGTCTEETSRLIMDRIRYDKVWSEKFEEIKQLHSDLQHLDLEQPSMRFTKNVMDDVTSTKILNSTESYINRKVIRWIGTLFLAVILFSLVYEMFSGQHSGSGILSRLSNHHINDLFGNGLSNLVIALDVIVGLAIAEKLFRRKAIRNHHEPGS